MSWDDLRFVLAVARAESIAGAARQLGVSHSTVYRRVRSFEEEHGAQCFERLADGVRLTEVGAALVAPLSDVERCVVAVERSLSQQQAQVTGSVTIAAPEALGMSLCAQLGPLLARYPDLSVRWRIGAERLSIDKGETDIALRAVSQPSENLFGRKIGHIAFAIYASNDYLRQHPVDDLASARWVVFDPVEAQSPQVQWEAANVPESAVVMRANRRMLLDEAIAAGHGIGITACALGEQRPGVTRVGEPIPELTLPLWILTHATLKDVPRVRVTLDMCADLLTASADLLRGGQT